MFRKLPKPPSLEELGRHIPSIAPVSGGTLRPFWSVMIPTFNRLSYLRKALESVLFQDPGPDEMQIEVIDNCSTKGDPEVVVNELGGSRVHLYRHEENVGPIENFNACLQRAQGKWIHILHDDDMVLPGFYDACKNIITSHENVVMVLGKVIFIDEEDRWIGMYGPLPPNGSTLLDDFLPRQAVEQLGQFAGLVVKRDAYEKVGGFCTMLNYVTDWDMWFRIGSIGRVGCTSQAYGLFRIHGTSGTSAQMVNASDIRERYWLTLLSLERVQTWLHTDTSSNWRSRLANLAETSAWQLDSQGCLEGRFNQARWTWMLDPNWRRLKFVLKSWLKIKLKRNHSAPTR
ncbi:MAG: glycosyltransferase [Verrucomicrobia bacterium]|nr:glycosyltransferase [Verrucomicrobiota bacterium]